MTNTLFPQPIAHRGLHDRAKGVIENSASAFDAAIAAGLAIECDVQLTSDGVPVIFHDEDMQRLLGKPGKIADTPAAEVTTSPLLDSAAGDCPQLFTAFLEQIAGRALLQIELKRQRDAASTRQLAQSVAAALATYVGPVTVESFDPNALTAIRDAGFTGLRGIITYDYARKDWDDGLDEQQRYGLRHLLHWHETQFDFISCDKDSLDLPAIKFWKALGKPVTAWTVKSQLEADTIRPHIDQIVFEGYIPLSAP
jgi:glycerophosphoryl diester phosphodiesterase